MYQLFFLVYITLINLPSLVFTKCLIKREKKLSFNGTLENNTIINLGNYSHNYNFTTNFILKYDSTNPNIKGGVKYQVLDIDRILRVYFQVFGGTPKLFFELLADYEENPPVQFDIPDDDRIYILIMRNNRVNWGYHLFYASNFSSYRYNIEDKPPTSFTKNSVLTIGGDPEEEILSFPGELGPFFISHVDIYEKPDANAYISLFHSGKSIVNSRYIPNSIVGRTF